MRSLFDVRVNWVVLVGMVFAILLIAPFISLLSFIALLIASFQFVLLFYSYGYLIPIRYLAGALMCLQMLIGPAFAYSGLDDYQYFKYKMQVSEYEYFSYAIPAVICFIIGLNINSRLRGEFVNEAGVKVFFKQKPMLVYLCIGIGFFASVASAFFSAGFDLVFYLLGSFKFVGAFILIIGSERLKPLPLILVFGSIIISSLGSAMFHDLFTWLMFLLAVLAIKYKPTVPVKAALGIGFIILTLIVQQLKGSYREVTQFRGQEGNADVFGDVYMQQNEKGGIFDKVGMAKSNVRINQGFIVTYILNNVPKNEPYANGDELYKILEAAFLPRLLAPDKLKAGDNSLFTKYSGVPLQEGTSMSLSALGDGYINFGVYGGCVFMFCLGGVFNFVLTRFGKIGVNYPIAILFAPLVFYFPMRPDTALQTGLGHLVKASFLLYMIFTFYKYQLTVKQRKLSAAASSK